MKSSVIGSFALALVLVVFSTPALVAQDEEKKDGGGVTEESKAALEEALTGLEGAFKEKSSVDIIHYAKAVSERFAGGDEKQQTTAIKELAKALKNRDRNVQDAALSALALTDEGATRYLLPVLKGPEAKDDLTFMCKCIASIGKLADPKAVDPLLKLLYHKDNAAIAQAVSALGDYHEADLGVRKDIVDGLLKVYASVASAANKTNPRTSDKEKYDFLFNSFESTLKRLTKKNDVEGANVWSTWFRKEGKKMKEW